MPDPGGMLTFRSMLVLVTLALASMAFGSEPLVRVVDGDTLELGGQRVRLYGIDAPERSQICDRNAQGWKCGQWSARVLQDLVASGSVRCVTQDRDSYGRDVAICRAGSTDLGQAMVQAGAALAYARYSARYVTDEAQARSAGRGVWSGSMVTPEAYRQADKPAAQSAPGSCAIKGNISASGRIYHMPGQRDYVATRIDPAKGEAWFCSARQAQAAGFRAARR